MANSQFNRPTANIRLRQRADVFSNTKQARASKVTSMIEIFSQAEKDNDVIPARGKRPIRNQTFQESRPKQEIVQRYNLESSIVPTPRARKLSPKSVPIGLRTPRPYVSEPGNGPDNKTVKISKGTDQEETSATENSFEQSNVEGGVRAEVRSTVDQVPLYSIPNKSVGLGKKPFLSGLQGIKETKTLEPPPKPIARKNLSTEMNFQGQNGGVNGDANGPHRIGQDGSKQGLGASKRTLNPVPVDRNNVRYSPEPSNQVLGSADVLRHVKPPQTRDDDRRISNARNYWEWKIDRSIKKSDSDSEPQKPNPPPKPLVNANAGTGVSLGVSKTKLTATSSLPGGPVGQRSSHQNIAPNSNPPESDPSLGSSPSARPRLNSSPQDDSTVNNTKYTVAERVKNFGQQSTVKARPKSDWPNGNITMATQRIQDSKAPGVGKTANPSQENVLKPAVPSRARFMTSAAGLRSEPKKLTSSLHGDSNIKSRYANFQKRPISPLARSPPPSPKPKPTPESSQNTTSPTSPKKIPPKVPEKPKNSPQKYPPGHPERPHQSPQRKPIDTNKVNPIPKPERTFTFTMADLKSSPKVRHWQKTHTRVSSDLSAINGPGSNESLAAVLSEELRQSMPNVSAGQDAYEQVAFCEVPGERSATMQYPRNTRKWQKQHNYEEVEDPADDGKVFAANYDRINLGKASSSHRPVSLIDLNNSYSHLTFQQDLHTSQSKPPPLPSTSSIEHLKLQKQNSDMSSISRSSSFSKSESGNTPRITDKIRDAFTQISRKYRHHRRSNDDNEDAKSISSSGDEDSDTEADIIKHKQTLDRVRTFQKTYRSTLKYKSLERDLSRFEEVTIFEQVLICKIVKGLDGKFSSKVSYRFPAPPPGKTMGDEKTLAHFCFPDIDVVKPCEKMSSQSYSFMLTRENGTRKFGYCRRILPPGTEPRYPVVYCLISPLGSFGLYELILDELEQRHRTSLKLVSVFLEALFVKRFPAPGRSVSVDINEPDGSSHFVLRRPFDTRLEHVDLQCLLSEVGVENAIKVFASLLLERRVILCGKSLSTMTACIHALRALLYPFVWQHVFVPVLPPPMVDLCCSPTPLLIGIMDTSIEKLKTLPLEEAFIFNIATRETVSSLGDEMEILPRKLQTPLINTLESFTNEERGPTTQPSYDFAMDYESAERNTVISEAFMHLFVEMIGHYQDHFQQVMLPTNARTDRFGTIQRNFNRTSFYDDVTSRSLRRFLDLFMGTQMFDGFIHSRELASPDYEGLFERRITHHIRNADASQLNFKVIKTKMKRLMQGIGKKK